MSDPLILASIAWVILAWTVLGFAIRRWGPGSAKRSVRCPEKHVLAKAVVLHSEGDFGSLKANDVSACSVFGDAPVTCGKTCLARL